MTIFQSRIINITGMNWIGTQNANAFDAMISGCDFFDCVNFSVRIDVAQIDRMVAKTPTDLGQAVGAFSDVVVMADKEIQPIVPMNRMIIMFIIERHMTNGPITTVSSECNSGVVETAIDGTVKSL